MFGVRKRRRPGEIKMEFTPMIDVVFLLLIFFMCTLKFKTLEGKLATYLPTDRGGRPTIENLEPVEKIRLKLSQRGDQSICYVNGRALGVLPEARGRLYQRIAEIRRASPRSPAEIDPDPAVQNEHVITVVDECMRARIEEITFTMPLPELKRKTGR